MSFKYVITCRSGITEVMHSDNAGNFGKVNKEFKDLVNQLEQGNISQIAANHGVQWSFNFLAAPYFSRIHEVMVEAAKTVIGEGRYK